MRLENAVAVYRMVRSGTALCQTAQAIGVTRDNIHTHPDILAQRDELEDRAHRLRDTVTQTEFAIGVAMAYARAPLTTMRTQEYGLRQLHS